MTYPRIQSVSALPLLQRRGALALESVGGFGPLIGWSSGHEKSMTIFASYSTLSFSFFFRYFFSRQATVVILYNSLIDSSDHIL